MTDGVLVALHGVVKRFGPVQALRGASLEVRRGEIHGLAGENGSGKSTLMRILVGDVTPDAGELTIDGGRTRWGAATAREAGIGLVHQEPHLAPDLTVAENVFMGRLPRRLGCVRRRELAARIAAVSGKTGMRIDPRRLVRGLTPDQRSIVEIAKVVAAEPRLIALDEPTASLTGDEVQRLFVLLTRMRDEGCSVILITHRLKELFAICDRTTVLRDGKTRGTLEVAATNEDELIRLMVGRELAETNRAPQRPGASALEVRSLTRGSTLRAVSLDVRAGEIVGLAGLVGAGRSALIRTLFGLRPGYEGEIRVAGTAVSIRSPRDAIGVGMGVIPEDRRGWGLCLDMSIAENIALSAYGHRRLVAPVSRAALRRQADQLVRDLSIRTRSVDTPVRSLSGGNQQKVVLARWLTHDLGVLILDEPTRGIDVGSKAEIYRILDALAARGLAILVSSSELPELLTLCDRIYAMYYGALVAQFGRDDATEESIARAISGAEAA